MMKAPIDRIMWLDIAKAIGILLVVIGHNPILKTTEYKWAHSFIFTFHMPLFFFLSGCVHRSKPIRSHISDKLRSIVYPYLFTGLAFAFYAHFLQGKNLVETILGLVLGIGNLMFPPHLWFLPCLFIVSILAHPLIERSKRQNSSQHEVLLALTAVFSLCFGKFLINVNNIGISIPSTPAPVHAWPLSADLAALALGFYLLGAYSNNLKIIKCTLQNIYKSQSTRALAGALSITLIVSALISKSAELDFNMRIATGNMVISAAIAGIIVVIMTAMSVKGMLAMSMSYIGQRSIMIFLFHYVIQIAVYNRLTPGISGACISIVASIALSLLIDRVTRHISILQKIYHPTVRRIQSSQ